MPYSLNANIFILYLQTLTTLNIPHNQIKDEGAKYFAEVLQQNTVSRIVLSIISSAISQFYVDTYCTGSQIELYWNCWSSTVG